VSTPRKQPWIVGRQPFILEGWRGRGVFFGERHYIGALRVPHFAQRLYSRRWYGAGTIYAVPWVTMARSRLRGSS
jgi:hypothetical protein